MAITTLTCSVKNFTSKKDKDFVRALSIYSKYIIPNIKTNTNEISDWLDDYNKKFEKENGDKFYVIGFYVEDNLAGYAQFVYIKENRLIIFDYLVIDPIYREYNAFFIFVRLLKEHIDKEKLIFDYAIAEVGCIGKDNKFSEESQLLVKLFRMERGGVIEAPYYQPKLGIENESTQIPAILMLFSFERIPEIGKETYLSIIDTIYFKHYCRWYGRYTDTIEKYIDDTKKLRQKIEKEISSYDRIKINGTIHLPQEQTTPQTHNNYETNKLSFVIVSTLFIAFLTVILLEIQNNYQIPLYAFTFIFTLSLISFFAVYATLSKNAMKVLLHLLQFIRLFSRKIK